MELIEIPFKLAEQLQPRFGHDPRSATQQPGKCHVSLVYGDLDRAINRRKDNGFTEDDLGEFAQVGFLWERVLENVLTSIWMEGPSADNGRWMRPGEVERDNLIGTPDNLDLDFRGDLTMAMGLEEWKCTWKSSDKGDNLEQNFWRWIVQQKAYCHMLGVHLSRLRVLFLVGNWRGSIVPCTRMWEFSFTPLELQENWSMLQGHARRKGWIK